MRCSVSLGCVLLWFTALRRAWAFCEKSMRSACACESSPCFSFTSVFSLFEKVGGLKGVVFFSLMRVTLSISVAVGVLTGCAVGMCLEGRKKMMAAMAVCVHGVLARDLLIIK